MRGDAFTENSFFECWDHEENLGLLHLQYADKTVLYSLEGEWRDWYRNTLRNGEPLDLDAFAEWLQLEHDGELIARRLTCEQLIV